MSAKEWSLHTELIELESTLLKLRSWEHALEYLGDYYSWQNPDVEWLVEHYTPSSALYWAFQRDFYRLTEEANEKFEVLFKKHREMRKEMEKS